MNLLTKIFLSRGLAKGPEIVGKVIRNGMTALGGYIVAHPVVVDGVAQPLFSAADWTTVTSAALIIGGAAWSIARTFLSAKVLPSV